MTPKSIFFENLLHPAFIASFKSDGKTLDDLIITTINSSFRAKWEKDIKDPSLIRFIKKITSPKVSLEYEKLLQEIIFPVNDKNINIGELKTFTFERDDEKIVGLKTKHLSGVKLINNGKSYIDIYTRIQTNPNGSFLGIQGLMPDSSIKASLQQQNRTNSIKSAIAAIMSRNMSHNLGSHVLSTVSTGINDPTDMQYLTRYIQQRQDYIAQITTDFPNWTYSYRFIGQVMRYFFEQRLLLKYISESEGLTAMEYYPSKLNTKGKLQIVLKKDGELIVPTEDSKKHDYVSKDPLLAIPGGITGLQAFYSILENIIRNAAKHSYSREQDKADGLQIIIDFSEKDTYVEFKISTNITINQKDIEDAELVDILNEKIKSSFITDNNELKYENWGIAEIKISAGYLSKISIDDIGNRGEQILYNQNAINNEKGIIKAFNENNLVGYQFHINKPKDVLFVLNDENSFYKNFYNLSTIKETFNNNGIYISDELPIELDFDFIIIENYDDDDINHKYPIRTLPFESSMNTILKEIANGFDKKSFEDLKILLYNIWINTNIDKQYCLYVNPYDPNGKGANVSISGINDYLKEKYADDINSENLRKKIGDDFYTMIPRNIMEDIDEIIVERIDDFTDDEYKSLDNYINDHFICKEDIALKIFKKYNEYIETLPSNYRFSTKEKDFDTNLEKEKTFNILLKETIKSLNNKSIIYGKKENAIILERHMSFVENNIAMYREALSGAQSYFNEVKSLKNDFNGRKLLFNIIETAHFHLHIIDERIAEFYQNANENIRARIDNGNIHIYTAINGISFIIDSEHNNITASNFLWNSNGERDPFDKKNILIIHQGILDKFQKQDKLKRLVIGTDIPQPEGIGPGKYFVTSGRGKPEKNKLPKNAKYIPFSSINTSLMKQYPEKMLLIQALLKISRI